MIPSNNDFYGMPDQGPSCDHPGQPPSPLFPLTPALSPSAGERGNPRQSVGRTDALGNRERLTSVLPLPRRGGEGRGEGEFGGRPFTPPHPRDQHLPRLTRRQFLALAGAAAALPQLVASRVLGADGQPGANERLTVAHIGVGGMGTVHLKNMKLLERANPLGK